MLVPAGFLPKASSSASFRAAKTRGYIETLLDDDLDDAPAGRFLETAQREALRLGPLVDGMLEFSLLDLSARALPAGTIHVAEQVESALNAL